MSAAKLSRVPIQSSPSEARVAYLRGTSKLSGAAYTRDSSEMPAGSLVKLSSVFEMFQDEDAAIASF